MFGSPAIALGAGLASALLFIVTVATASPAGILPLYVSPLPIMIAALGFRHLTGLFAALVGGLAVAGWLGWMNGAGYLLLIGLPAWILGYVSLLARTDATGASEWYPVPLIVLWTVGLCVLAVLLIGLFVMIRLGGFERSLRELSRQFAAAMQSPPFPENISATQFVLALPPVFAAVFTVMISANLWLAARAVQISHRLTRPWPSLPEQLRLPRSAVAALAAAVAGSFLPNPLGLAAEVVAAGLALAFAAGGLATAHALTRDISSRRLLLAGIYLTIVMLFPLPLLGLAILGCVDSFVPLRRGPPAPPPIQSLRS